MTVIERITKIMRFNNIKQKDLANFLQVKPTTVSKMLNGKREIKVYDFYVMSIMFKCTIDDLLGANKLLDALLDYYDNTPRLIT